MSLSYSYIVIFSGQFQLLLMFIFTNFILSQLPSSSYRSESFY